MSEQKEKQTILYLVCLLVSPYYTYPNQSSQIYPRFVCLYFVTSVSCQIKVFVVIIIKQCYYRT